MDQVFEGTVSGRAQILSTLGSLTLFSLIIYLIRKGKLKSGYSILWFLTFGAILGISVSETALFWFSKLIGVYYAPSAVFSILIVGLILVVVHFSVILSGLEQKNKTLTQEITLLKEKVGSKVRKNQKIKKLKSAKN